MSAAFPLWPDGAPGLDQATPAFEPTLTPYLCAAATPTGCVIVLPGGGYVGRADHEGEPIARWLNSLGLSAFVCDYRVAPYRHPYPSLDAGRAVRWVRAHAAEYGVLPGNIGLLGFSAGGVQAPALHRPTAQRVTTDRALETRPESPSWRNGLPVEAPTRPVARSLSQEDGFPARPLVYTSALLTEG